MPGPEPWPATIDIDGTVVTIVTHVREGDGTAEHNRTPSYIVSATGGLIGVVWHLNRGEERHNDPRNQHSSDDYAELIWFARPPLGPVLGPYPGIVEAITALLA